MSSKVGLIGGWLGLGGSLLLLTTGWSCQAIGSDLEIPASEVSAPEVPVQENLVQENPAREALELEVPAIDTLQLPATTRTVTTANGHYSFTVQAHRNWETDQVSGQLSRHSTLGTQQLWQQNLPHSYGPRYMVVGTQGQVLLLDEVINVASPYAVMLFDASGNVIAQHSFDEIEAQLGVHRAEMVEQAESGWWLSAPPQLDEATGKVTLETGGKTLNIDLTTGRLGL